MYYSLFIWPYSTGLSIGFVDSSYTVMENDGRVEVCVRFMGPLKNNSSVELEIMLESDTASSK